MFQMPFRLRITKYQYHDFAMLLHSLNSMILGRIHLIIILRRRYPYFKSTRWISAGYPPEYRFRIFFCYSSLEVPEV